MKTSKGLSIGNYVRVISTQEIIQLNSITGKKVGTYREDHSGERYFRLHEIELIPLTDKFFHNNFEYVAWTWIYENKFRVSHLYGYVYLIECKDERFMCQYLNEFQNKIGFSKKEENAWKIN